MKRFSQWLAAALLAVSAWQAPVQAAENPYVETEEVFYHVMESHLSKPQAAQLVKGALQAVSEQAKERKKLQLAVSPEDDTWDELEQRLVEWQSKGGFDAASMNVWAIDGMLSTLDDPHSVFFTADELRLFQSDVENQFVGFGFRLRMQNDHLIIREIVPGSPAAASVLKRGDQLQKVNEVSLVGKSFEESYAYLKGAEGTEAVLTVYRPAEKRELQVKLKRAMMTLPEAEGQLFSDGSIGYISLETFGSEGALQMRDKLLEFARSPKPLTGLVLDLRDNGGGYLATARDIASLFMEEGLLMYTTNRNGVEVETWVRNGRDINVPVRILVNGGTASASELLSGALRDHGIAKLIGTKTYGKGSAQQVIPLSAGDALKLTLNEYFTPKHTVVNHIGLTPDILVEDYGAQVIEALHSLNVRQWELSDEDGDTVINGIPFPTVEPLFKQGTNGLQIRAAVLSHLLKDPEIGEKEYVELSPYLHKHSALKVQSKNGFHVLTYTS
ncbi:S41 family peptidase [Brevibacillus agri]|uniref:S41 family peptidase n=1 Tax=Brevibacillus agri TaxID=51101 RepID=UPI0018CE7E49|nr:S41 family peptidase [Brevibacillus agri]MBG9565545.1 peptidase S41 [Brevibacillus agri]MED1825402.1 S41 family peptidase [Brevibacillus agri]MED4570904.1 S41 family peptidase [Brevibacillus agri]WHX32636.1 S41 family peptidase [Brevibacillus agri]